MMLIIALKHHKAMNILIISSMLLTGLSIPTLYHANHSSVSANATAYDISQYQGTLTSHQVKHLKHEVSFVILRAQASVPDWKISHNIHLMNKYHIPYGVYSYSYYTSPSVAKREARNLYRIAPNAKFYVNDCEENDAGYQLNKCTKVWSHTLHHLTNRPIVLYSYLYFMSKFSRPTINSYDTTWIADYGSQPRTDIHYDLWQFADNYYSRALGQRLDADDIPSGSNVKPLSFWIGNSDLSQQSSNVPIKTAKPANSKALQNKLTKLVSKVHHHAHHHKIHHYNTSSYYHNGHYFMISNASGVVAKYKHHYVTIPNGTKLYIHKFVHKSNGEVVAYTHYRHHLVSFHSNKSYMMRYKKHIYHHKKVTHSQIHHVYVHHRVHHNVVTYHNHKHRSHKVPVLKPQNELNFGYYQSN